MTLNATTYVRLSRPAADGRFATGCVSMRVQYNAELARPAKSVGGLPDLRPYLKHRTTSAIAEARARFCPLSGQKTPPYGKFSDTVRREAG